MDKSIKGCCKCGLHHYADGRWLWGKSMPSGSAVNPANGAYCYKCGCFLDSETGLAYPMVRAEELAEVEKELAVRDEALSYIAESDWTPGFAMQEARAKLEASDANRTDS